jgi:hypothetical protein
MTRAAARFHGYVCWRELGKERFKLSTFEIATWNRTVLHVNAMHGKNSLRRSTVMRLWMWLAGPDEAPVDAGSCLRLHPVPAMPIGELHK